MNASTFETFEERYAKEPSTPYSDDALAEAFADKHRHDLRYCDGWGCWMRYDGRRWRKDATLEVRDLTRAICREAAGSSNKPGARVALASAKKVFAVEQLARADRRLAATTDQWDADPWALNTPTGVVDLKSSTLRPHDPADHMTLIAGAAPGGDCPLFRSFMRRITGEDVELEGFIQRTLGYALTGSTSAHALFFAYGLGANGKSVLIDTVGGILGDYHKTAPVETFTASAHERHPTELAMLRGARLVTAVETEEGRRWAESRIKSLTGGDRIAARFMRQDFFEFEPQFKLLIAGNHKPGLRSVDEAIRRRFHMIPFSVTIPPQERDEDLKGKLRAEWPGILAWMIEGCLEWQRGGLRPPEAVRKATDDYLEAEDAVGAWIEECCRRDPKDWATSSTLFASWKAWAEQAGEPVGASKQLGQALEARGFPPKRYRHARGYQGLNVIPREPDDDQHWRRG